VVLEDSEAEQSADATGLGSSCLGLTPDLRPGYRMPPPERGWGSVAQIVVPARRVISNDCAD